ncbi:hypothetical protein PHISP_06950 [Aspergillus sp. HF37]|nr:hypothetical protein PHISP_06950 [Aspergillus sp. HF37]
MWGKGHSDRAERPVIGNPTLVNKSLDDSVYESLSPIGAAAVDRGDRAPTANPAASGHHRDALSVYSRDGWEMPGQPSSSTWHDHHPSGRHIPDYKPNSSVWQGTTNISPPDSPVSASGARQGSGRVSPLEEEPPGSMQTEKNKHASHLPVFRKSPRKDSLAAQPGGSKSEQNPQNRSRITRWDYFFGESTTSGTGKAAPLASGHAPFQPQPAPKQPAASQHSGILNWSREQFQPIKKFAEARSSRLTKNDNTLPHTAGRLPVTNPLHEKQRGRAPSRADLSKTSDQHQNQAPPVSAAPGFRPTVVTTISAGPSMSATPEKRSASKRATSDHHSPPPTNQNSNTAPPRVDLPQSTLDPTLAGLQLEEQPPSRFSFTTYEPTESGSATDSPRDSVAGNESMENLNSIMSRRRPVPSGMITPGKMPIRKPTPSQASEDSTTKPLPECPPEKQAETRVEALEARRDTLARRKANIETIIHELTQVVQPSSVAYDIAVRDEVKRTVSSLNSELADVKREDHEIGLKLFRAYKKRDEQGHYAGSTGLWVKRVTS